MSKNIGFIILFFVGIVLIFVSQRLATRENPSSSVTPTLVGSASTSPTSQAMVSILDLSRVTKKPFGLYVTPATSPVQPEKFTGYHSGADFETTPEEANMDVLVPALCDGKLLLKKTATGYGGVAVQSCVLDGQAVTVVYGHLNISSVATLVGQELKKGDKIGVLGKGYSSETDGERKHLHLGIHKGTGVVILGYVQKQSDLLDWIDPKSVLH